MTTWTCFGNYKDLNFLLQGLLHSRFPKGAINPLMEYLIILVFGCSTYDVTRVVCCVCNELMVFKLIPWNYPFSSWLGYGTLDMIEGGGHSHESSRTASALSHICNRVCRKIIRMPAYLSPHKRPKKRRDEKSGSAQQGEKLGCGHHHAETHQSPIETSSISPSYTPYAPRCCGGSQAKMENSALKMDDSTWESWLMRKVSF